MKAKTLRAAAAAILLLLLLLSTQAWAVTFYWSAPTVPVTSYRLRLGTNANVFFSTNTIAGSATNFVIALNPDVAYFGTLTAWTTNGAGVGPAGLESLPSNEVQFVIPPAPVLRIQSSIDWAPTPAGPWELLTNSAPLIVEVPLATARFYRGILELERQPAVSP